MASTTGQHLTHWIARGAAIMTIFSTIANTATAVPSEGSTSPYEHETREERDVRMGWWREARFGMFIHWGVYAVPAGIHEGKRIDGYGEWIMSKA